MVKNLLLQLQMETFTHLRWFKYFKPACCVSSSALCHVGQQHWGLLLLTFDFALFTESHEMDRVFSPTFGCGLVRCGLDLLCGGSLFIPSL